VLRGATQGQAHIPGYDAADQTGLVRSAEALAAQVGRRAVICHAATRQSHV